MCLEYQDSNISRFTEVFLSQMERVMEETADFFRLVRMRERKKEN